MTAVITVIELACFIAAYMCLVGPGMPIEGFWFPQSLMSIKLSVTCNRPQLLIPVIRTYHSFLSFDLASHMTRCAKVMME